MPQIKIAHVTLSLGGVKTYLEHLLNHADKQSFQHVILAPLNPELEQLCQQLSITFYPIESRRNVSLLKDLQALLQIITFLKREKPHIVHAHSAKGGLLGRIGARLLGIKTIYSPHAFSYLSFTGFSRVAYYLLEYFSKPLTNILLSVSHSEASRAIHEVGYNPERVKVVLNAIPLGEAPETNFKERVEHIGMIGRLTAQKNPLLFLKIANSLLKIYPHLSFSILGAGMTDNLTNEMDDYIQQHGLNDKVQILGWGDNQTSNLFLKSTDIFVLTSAFEGLPFSLLEAMSLGIPCVTTKADGNTDVINNNENGFSCSSISEFVQKLSLLIEDSSLRNRLGTAGYKHIKAEYNIINNVNTLQEIYLRLPHFKDPIHRIKAEKINPLSSYNAIS